MIDYKMYANKAIKLIEQVNEDSYNVSDELAADLRNIAHDWEQDHTVGEFPLPEWAEAYNHNYEPVLRAQLCTKDGRRFGNARIVEIIDDHPLFPKDRIYKIRTDVGTEFNLMKSELDYAFYVGMYIMKAGQ